jgi:hypothetical protein
MDMGDLISPLPEPQSEVLQEPGSTEPHQSSSMPKHLTKGVRIQDQSEIKSRHWVYKPKSNFHLPSFQYTQSSLHKGEMTEFSHSYKMSAIVFAIMVALACLGSLGGEVFMIGILFGILLVGLLPFLPLLLRGGLDHHWRFAFWISVLLALVSTGLLGFLFVEFIRSNGLEGPQGEGAPGAVVFAMLFFALTVQCPWLVTALRGMRLWRNGINNEQDRHGDPS